MTDPAIPLDEQIEAVRSSVHYLEYTVDSYSEFPESELYREQARKLASMRAVLATLESIDHAR